MYSLYIPKYQGEPAGIGRLPGELGHFMESTHYAYDLLVSPGYLSKKVGYIDAFLTSLEAKFTGSGKKQVGLGLFYGMNGGETAKGSTLSIRKEHIDAFPAHTLEEIKVKPKDKKRADHRKMIFFFERGAWKRTDVLDKSSKDRFLAAVTVQAVLIGSSNFSWNTYWDGGNPSPQKGEADLLMFTDERYKESIQERITETPSMVLFQSIAGGGGASPQAFFKEILDDFLSHSLA